MTGKQKKMLARILVSAVLLVAAKLLPLSGAFQLVAFLVPYAVIGWDIVWKALRNIAHGQVFDENFLMTIATVGAFCTGEFPEQEQRLSSEAHIRHVSKVFFMITALFRKIIVHIISMQPILYYTCFTWLCQYV